MCEREVLMQSLFITFEYNVQPSDPMTKCLRRLSIFYCLSAALSRSYFAFLFFLQFGNKSWWQILTSIKEMYICEHYCEGESSILE